MANVSPGAAPGGRRILGLKPRTALIVLGVAVAGAAAYFLWRRHQSSSSASAGASSASASAGAYGMDYGGQLSTIQSELEDLLAAGGSQPSSGSGSSAGGGGGSVTSGPPGQGSGGSGVGNTDTPPPTHGTINGKPPGVGSAGEGTVPGTTGGTVTKTKPKPGIPVAVHATKTTANAVTLAWTKAPNATSYRVRATYQGKLVGSQQTVNGTSATISGLHPDHTYTFHVASVGPGGTSAETNGPAVKTSR